MSDFVHLRTRSHHSLQEGFLDSEQLIEKAVEHGHSAIALTDLRTMSQAVDFYSHAKTQGVKPIIGVEVWLETDLTAPDQQQPTRLLLLAENNDGYKKLMRLLSRANAENVISVGGDDMALVKQSWLKEWGTEGIVALTGTPDFGELPRAAVQEDPSKAAQDVKKILTVYKDLFKDRLFLEVSRFGHAQEDLWVQRLVQLSVATNIPLVATQGVLFGDRTDFFAHEIHSAITSKTSVLDPEYVPVATREQYYRSTEEMMELFSDIPQAVENAVLLAQRCNVQLELGVNQLPKYPLPEGERDIDSYFVKAARAGLDARLRELFPDPAVRATKQAEYQTRLDDEVNVILNMGFPGYFLVVSDFIRWSKDKGIPVGPGRGSGAGSLVAYSLNITDLDPIEHSLLFERFLNPERVSMPDIDVDFCRDRRDETLQYLFERYGEDSVAQIATVSSLAAKAAIRHAGNALNYPLPRVEEIVKIIPKKDIGVTLDEALEKYPALNSLYTNEKSVRRLINMARKIEGTALTTGVHAGGVLISPTRIDDFSPVMRAAKGVMVSQYDKDDVEKAGLIKFDLLGIKGLTFLEEVKNLVNKRPDRANNPIALNKISIHDPQALNLLCNSDTYGIFQLESRGMSQLVKDLRPDTFEDVVAVLALFRPGPLESGMVSSFVRRKHGQEEISYFHPQLEKILKPTYGVIVYQEQVMQIAQTIAGYTLGGADLLRRAMGKKKPEEMAKERSKFETGAAANGVDPKLATELFDMMEKFAAYGFNRSHSAAYAVLSMQTAYFKANYPTEFFTAYMNVEIKNTDVLKQALNDAQRHNIKFLPPDINDGSLWFEPVGDNTIRYALSALKGASEKSIFDIIDARTAVGRFESFQDYLFKVNTYLRDNGRNTPLKLVTETLIRAGAFDSLNPNRAELIAALPAQLEYLGKLNKRNASKNNDTGEVLLPNLWKAVGVTPIPAPLKPSRKQKKPLDEPVWPNDVPAWDDFMRLSQEAKSVGFYLTGHPAEAYMRQFAGLEAALPLEEVANYEGNPYATHLIAGVISDVFVRKTKKDGREMANLTLDNGTTQIRAAVFPDAYDLYQSKLKVGNFVALEASIRAPKTEGYTEKDVGAQRVFGKEDLEALLVKDVHVALLKNELPLLEDLHNKHKGTHAGCVVYMPDGTDRYFRADLPHIKWSGSVECLDELRKTFPNRVQLEFQSSVVFEQDRGPRRNQNNNSRTRSYPSR